MTRDLEIHTLPLLTVESNRNHTHTIALDVLKWWFVATHRMCKMLWTTKECFSACRIFHAMRASWFLSAFNPHISFQVDFVNQTTIFQMQTICIQNETIIIKNKVFKMNNSRNGQFSFLCVVMHFLFSIFNVCYTFDTWLICSILWKHISDYYKSRSNHSFYLSINALHQNVPKKNNKRRHRTHRHSRSTPTL